MKSIVVVLLVGMMGSSILAMTLSALNHEIISHHHDGTPCPDTHGTDPCDGACPCLCCPGHISALAAANDFALVRIDNKAVLNFPPPGDLFAPGFIRGVFRPPRV